MYTRNIRFQKAMNLAWLQLRKHSFFFFCLFVFIRYNTMPFADVASIANLTTQLEP